MGFRADEAARAGLENALSYLLPHTKGVDHSERARENEELFDILRECGPAVDAYPSWHPLVRNHDDRHPVTVPGRDCGYEGLDHTRYFVSGFITCPYGDGQDVLDSVAKLPNKPGAVITAERLNLRLYNFDATPVLVKCNWERPVDENGMIPLALAMPLLLEKELPCWQWSGVAETWDRMRPYFLGTPHGSRSSLFVSQETGQAMKKVWEALINTGMYGPIRV
jgi:hypothetical protein